MTTTNTPFEEPMNPIKSEADVYDELFPGERIADAITTPLRTRLNVEGVFDTTYNILLNEAEEKIEQLITALQGQKGEE